MAEVDWSARADVWGEPTDWSLIAGASRARSGPEAERRWKTLLERYRHPVGLAVRRKLRTGGEPPEDMVDAFFTYLYTADVLAKVDKQRGRFRCFLQVVLRRFVAHEANRAYNRKAVPLVTDVAVEDTPELEQQEEAEWASEVLKNALAELMKENPRGAEILMRSHGIKPYPQTTTAALCAEFEIKPNALYQVVYRAKRRLRDLITEEIRHTVVSEPDFEEEKRVIIGRLLEAYSHVFTDPSG